MTLLPASFWWSDDTTASHLHYNAGGVASVKREGARWIVVIRWKTGREMSGPCGSREQGKRFVERWIDARLNGARRRMLRETAHLGEDLNARARPQASGACSASASPTIRAG